MTVVGRLKEGSVQTIRWTARFLQREVPQGMIYQFLVGKSENAQVRDLPLAVEGGK